MRDEESGSEEQIDPAEVAAIVEEHRDIIQFLVDWEGGLFAMSKTDYETMPATLIEARRIFQSTRRDARGNQSS